MIINKATPTSPVLLPVGTTVSYIGNCFRICIVHILVDGDSSLAASFLDFQLLCSEDMGSGSREKPRELLDCWRSLLPEYCVSAASLGTSPSHLDQVDRRLQKRLFPKEKHGEMRSYQIHSNI